MSELSSELALCLSNAQELVEKGKQKQALEQLWFAEALARGEADALREVLDVTTAFGVRVEPRRKSDLAELVQVLHHGIDAAPRQSLASPPRAETFATPKSRLAAPLSVLSILFATGAALFMWFYLTNPDILCLVGTLQRGANIKNAVELVSVVGLAALFLLLLARKRRRLIAPVLVLEAATLIAALGLVALDSSTYVATEAAAPLCGGTWSRHVGYLYFLWGVPLAVLSLQAFRISRNSRKSTSGEPVHG